VSKGSKAKIVAAIPGVLLILVAATGLTMYAQRAVAEATKPKPVVVKKVVVVKKEEPKAVTPAPAPAPVVPATPTATTNSFVYLRPTASTAGTPLAGLNAGTVVQYTVKTTTAWQKVTVDGKTGYVYKKWLTY